MMFQDTQMLQDNNNMMWCLAKEPNPNMAVSAQCGGPDEPFNSGGPFTRSGVNTKSNFQYFLCNIKIWISDKVKF